jgi:TusA-related sulfurtransferase
LKYKLYALQILGEQTMSILTQTVDRELDTKGLSCPLPILKAKKTLAEMSSGQTLRIVATDAGSVRDFQAFAKQTGNTLIGQQEDGATFVHLMQRK